MERDRGSACRVLMRRPDGKRPLGRPRHRWGDNIKIYLKEMGWVTWMAWTGLIWLMIRAHGGLL